MFKKLMIIGIALMATSTAFATEYQQEMAGAVASAGTMTAGSANGGASAHGNSGPNFAFQGSASTANNVTSVGAFSNGSQHSSNVGTFVDTVGNTTSVSGGVRSGRAYGSTNTFASQNAGGFAFAEGEASDTNHRGPWGAGETMANAFAAQGSNTSTSNVNNGAAAAVSGGNALADTAASLHIDANHTSVDVEQDSSTTVEAGGYADSVRTGRGHSSANGGGYANGAAGTYAIMSTLDDGTFNYDND